MVPQIPWFPPSLNMCSCDPALKRKKEKKKPQEKEMCFGHSHPTDVFTPQFDFYRFNGSQILQVVWGGVKN